MKDDAALTQSSASIDAARQFKDLIDLSEKGDLVSSYTFSDTERVIYYVWYPMTVSFKKNFFGEGDDASSSDKRQPFSLKCAATTPTKRVGEVTAFGGSLGVTASLRRPVKGSRFAVALSAFDRQTRRFWVAIKEMRGGVGQGAYLIQQSW